MPRFIIISGTSYSNVVYRKYYFNKRRTGNKPANDSESDSAPSPVKLVEKRLKKRAVIDSDSSNDENEPENKKTKQTKSSSPEFNECNETKVENSGKQESDDEPETVFKPRPAAKTKTVKKTISKKKGALVVNDHYDPVENAIWKANEKYDGLFSKLDCT